MIKHIAGQSIYQLIILTLLVFYGEQFIPEYPDSYDSTIFANNPEYKWLNGVVGGTVRSGRFHTVPGGDDYITVFHATDVYSRHFTFIFNAFVMLQIFNFLNARKLHEEVPIIVFSLMFLKESQEILCSFSSLLEYFYFNFFSSPFQGLLLECTTTMGSLFSSGS